MSPFAIHARLFLAAATDAERLLAFSEAVEWLENRAETSLDDGLKRRIYALLCTAEGRDLLHWAIGNDREDVTT